METEKYKEVEKIAEELVLNNIWPSAHKIAVKLGKPDGSAVHYLKKWRIKIGLHTARIGSYRVLPTDSCSKECLPRRLNCTKRKKTFCAKHYRVTDFKE